MRRYLLAALVGLMVTPGVGSAQMMGGDRGGNDMPQPMARHEMRPQVQAPGPNTGMPGRGMMSGMMDQNTEMMRDCKMQGRMMGHDMMPSMMSSMMDGMMPGKTRGCMMMAEGMMRGQIDVAQMRKALALSDEQVERLRASQRPFQKETILTLASMKVAELELADLLAADKADFGKVEAKLKEIEGMHTKVRLAQIKAMVAVKAILSVEQLERLQGMSESAPPPPAAAAPPSGTVPQPEPDHEQHH